MAFNPQRLPEMQELEEAWLELRDQSKRRPYTSSVLRKPPYYYLAPCTILGLTRASSKPQDRNTIEAAANWGDPHAQILQMLVIREDAEVVEAMPGGDEPKDRQRVVDEWNYRIEGRQLALSSLVRLLKDLPAEEQLDFVLQH